jgi:hypothetical protein
MYNTLVLTTTQHARTVSTGVPVQFAIQWALIALLLVAMTFVILRTRGRTDDDTLIS